MQLQNGLAFQKCLNTLFIESARSAYAINFPSSLIFVVKAGILPLSEAVLGDY